MKWLPLLSCIFFLSCSDQATRTTQTPVKGSKAEKSLHNLNQRLTTDYEAATNAITRQEILATYQAQLNRLIADTLGGSLDSIEVEVINIEPLANRLYSMAFRNESADFDITIDLNTLPKSQGDSLYNLLKSIDETSFPVISFKYLGECEVRSKTDLFRGLKIKALPVQLIKAGQ